MVKLLLVVVVLVCVCVCVLVIVSRDRSESMAVDGRWRARFIVSKREREKRRRAFHGEIVNTVYLYLVVHRFTVNYDRGYLSSIGWTMTSELLTIMAVRVDR